jgi:hypothetical protein
VYALVFQRQLMHRQPQIVLIFSLLVTSWLAMQVVHELGHVLGAWYTGGTVIKVVLRPWTISRTQIGVNPAPLFVTWAGPLVGAALPLLGWLAASAFRCPLRYLLRFFAGFCLVANGAYIGGGALERIGDAGDLRRHGSPLWLLFVFGAVAVSLGLALWHRQGRYFGFAGANGYVNRWAIFSCLVALLAVLAVDFVFGSA